jgi:hypothetical protein
MTFELKTLHADALPRALEKAERYRLLNEPGEAESICLDVLAVDRDNQAALVTLLLAITDQFDVVHPSPGPDAHEVIARMGDPYARAYYTGIVYERRAKAQLHQHTPASGPRAYGALREAMLWFEKAEQLRPAGNDDALLRWNACARLLMNNPRLAPVIEERGEPLLLE